MSTCCTEATAGASDRPWGQGLPAAWAHKSRAKSSPLVEHLVVFGLRDAIPEDAAGVEAVWAAVAAEGEWIGTELPLRPDWQDRFRQGLTSATQAWMVTESGSEVIGAVFVQEERGLAHLGMAIPSEHRGVGLGRLLLDSAVQWSRDRECHKVTLEVWPHNERAHRLYRSAGFEDEGYLKRHYRRKSGALWDAVAMGLVLDRTSPSRP